MKMQASTHMTIDESKSGANEFIFCAIKSIGEIDQRSFNANLIEYFDNDKTKNK